MARKILVIGMVLISLMLVVGLVGCSSGAVSGGSLELTNLCHP